MEESLLKIEILFNLPINHYDCQELITTNNENIKLNINIIDSIKCIYTYNNLSSNLKIRLNETNLKNNITKILLDKSVRLDNLGYQFANLINLEEIVAHPENFYDVTNTEGIFLNTKIIPENIGDLLTNSVNLKMAFKDCKSKKKINLSKLNFLIWMNNCFENSLFEEISLLDLPNIQSIDYLFVNSKAKKIYCQSLNISNLISLEGIFKDCKNLEQITIDHWDTKNINNMSYLFYNTSNIKKSLSFKSWNTYKVNNMTAMFRNSSISSSLIYFNMSSIKTTRNMLLESKYSKGSNYIINNNIQLINSNLWNNNEIHLFELDSEEKKNKWKQFWNDGDLFLQVTFNKTITRSQLFSILEFMDNNKCNKSFSSVKELNLIFKEQMHTIPLKVWKIYNLLLFNIDCIHINGLLNDKNIKIVELNKNKILNISINDNIQVEKHLLF